MDIDFIISAIKNAAPATVSLAIQQASRNEYIIKVLIQVGLDSVQPPKDVEGVYAYALVKYGVFKPESILNLFRKKEVKAAFWDAFNGNPLDFVRDVEPHWESMRGEAQIDLRKEYKEFYDAFFSVATRSRNPGDVIVDPHFTKLPEVSSYPDDFKALIEEKIRTFRGRGFVFDEFNRFLDNHTKGYFTVVGDAGMGKSAIAAKYVYDHKAICYFNVLVEGRNKPEQFLNSIRQQLNHRYQLQDSANANLPGLLNKVSEKLATDQRLVIVVDALDEVEQPGSGNLLDLPKNLPDRIYFLLTRRPYQLKNKRLSTDEGVKQQELDLRADQYAEFNKNDIKDYISFFINDDPDYQDNLKNWIDRKHISPPYFIEQLTVKSENNFMYLSYVLPDIAKGYYNELSFKQLPNGLLEYYAQHWQRMGMEKAPQELMVIILFILVQIPTSPTVKIIADIAGKEEYEVEEVLEQWVEYLRKREIQGELCYSIYHASFLDFLKSQRDLKPTRKLFETVEQRISDYLY